MATHEEHGSESPPYTPSYMGPHPEGNEVHLETPCSSQKDFAAYSGRRDYHDALMDRLRRHEKVVVERLDRLELLVLRRTGTPVLGESAGSGARAESPHRFGRPPGGFDMAFKNGSNVLSSAPFREDVAMRVSMATSSTSVRPRLGERSPTIAEQILEEIDRYNSGGEERFCGRAFTDASAGEVNLNEGTKSRATVILERSKSFGHRVFPPLPKHNLLARCTRSWKFNTAIAGVICLNAIIIGAQTNSLVGEAFSEFLSQPSNALSFQVPSFVNWLFAVFFTLECGWRAYVDRSNFLFGPQWRWNAFDFFLVVSNLVEVFTEIQSLAYARTLRLMRMVHVLQVIRVLRVFDVLRHMVYAILSSMLSLAWIIMVLALMLYVYGVFLISVVGQHVQSLQSEQPGATLDPQVRAGVESLETLFGTLSRSMLSLFEGVTGGRNYYEIVQLLVNIHWLHAVTFLMFFIFIVLGVLNIVTGIFVERATELTKLDKEMTVMHQLDEMNNFVEELKRFFRRADSDNSGCMSWEEFRDQLRDEKVRAYFVTMGIDVQSACRVFQMLDRKGSGIVDIKDFVEGCIRLKGQAKSMDVCMLMLDVRRLGNMLEVLMRYTEDELGSLQEMLAPAERRLSTTSIDDRLTELTARNSSRQGFHPLAHAFRYNNSRHTASVPFNEQEARDEAESESEKFSI